MDVTGGILTCTTTIPWGRQEEYLSTQESFLLANVSAMVAAGIVLGDERIRPGRTPGPR